MRIHSPKLSLAWRILASLVVGLAVFSPPILTSAHEGAIVIEGVPSLKQKYSLSCEYAAAAAVTLFWGGEVVSQDHFIREVPNHPNPHLGFRGDIDGPHGETSDYGIYAEPLVPVLQSHGYEATVFYGGVARLKAEINDGHPVVVWLTTGKDSSRTGYYETYGGKRFKLVPYEHTVVVYGYDEDGVYVMDVGDVGKYYTEWNSFTRRWSSFDQMALLIHPR